MLVPFRLNGEFTEKKTKNLNAISMPNDVHYCGSSIFNRARSIDISKLTNETIFNQLKFKQTKRVKNFSRLMVVVRVNCAIIQMVICNLLSCSSNCVGRDFKSSRSHFSVVFLFRSIIRFNQMITVLKHD